MAVDAVQKNNSNSHRMSYIGSLAVGALGGYAAKWAIPLTEAETTDQFYKDELSKIKKNTIQARKDEIEVIRKEVSSNPVADEFIKLNDSSKYLYSEIKKLKNSSQDKLLDLLQRVNDKTLEINKLGKDKLAYYTKSIRPTSAFIVIGMFAAVVVAVINNVLKETACRNNECIDESF